MARYALDAQRAVGDARGVNDKHADNLGKAQCGDAQIVVAQAQHGHGDDEGKIAATSPPASTETQKGVMSSEKGQMMGSRIHIISFCSGDRMQRAET